MIVEGVKYYIFNNSLNQMLKDKGEGLKPITNEQMNMYAIVNRIKVGEIELRNKIITDYEEKNHIISDWIHKSKTPISIIDLIIQGYKEGSIIPSKAMEDIENENYRLHCSTEQLLNLIRLDGFEKDYNITSVDILSSLREVINRNKNQFIYNNVFPVIQYNEKEVFIISDMKWNELILQQVISNAIKYSGENNENKKIYFNIKIQGDNTILSIKDEGIGIEEYDLSRVFDPFFTGENGRRVRNSTGIGLYIAREIGNKLGHKIEINSKPLQGTEVIIRYLSKL
ncbi:sensor histidine kinase [Clostridium sp.]|uniref:sensor histidine kinase n=1 Tax=Clostridium sp. TaxID=1506 RepID=UPI0034638FB1